MKISLKIAVVSSLAVVSLALAQSPVVQPPMAPPVSSVVITNIPGLPGVVAVSVTTIFGGHTNQAVRVLTKVQVQQLASQTASNNAQLAQMQAIVGQ